MKSINYILQRLNDKKTIGVHVINGFVHDFDSNNKSSLEEGLSVLFFLFNHFSALAEQQDSKHLAPVACLNQAG